MFALRYIIQIIMMIIPCMCACTYVHGMHFKLLCNTPVILSQCINYASGIGRIYVYDHGSDEPLANQLKDLIAEGKVVVSRFEGKHQRFAGGSSLNFLGTAQVNKYIIWNQNEVNVVLGVFVFINTRWYMQQPGGGGVHTVTCTPAYTRRHHNLFIRLSYCRDMLTNAASWSIPLITHLLDSLTLTSFS